MSVSPTEQAGELESELYVFFSLAMAKDIKALDQIKRIGVEYMLAYPGIKV